jgi:hypothetical protein
MPLNISFTSLLALMHAVAPLESAKMLSPPKWPRTRVHLFHANSRRQKLHDHIKLSTKAELAGFDAVAGCSTTRAVMNDRARSLELSRVAFVGSCVLLDHDAMVSLRTRMWCQEDVFRSGAAIWLGQGVRDKPHFAQHIARLMAGCRAD